MEGLRHSIAKESSSKSASICSLKILACEIFLSSDSPGMLISILPGRNTPTDFFCFETIKKALSLYSGSICELPAAACILIYNRYVKKSSRFGWHAGMWCLLGALLLMLAAVSCTAYPVDRPWVYADLRRLDMLDASGPATDILAVYTRFTDLSVDIRIDLLDINTADKYTLKMVLWDNQDFSQNPLRIDISSTGKVQTSGVHAGKPAVWPRVIQDRQLDTVTVTLNRFFIGERFHLDISTYSADPAQPADEVHNVRSDDLPPEQRAPVIVAFWEAFPVTTPAQALRRWDGAHTGPLGDRHGLLHILEGAGQYNIPVVLLDVKNPASLAALNFMGHIPVLKDLYGRGLLILPDVAYGEPADIALDFSRLAASGFGLPPSQFVYMTSSNPSTPSSYSFPGQQQLILGEAWQTLEGSYQARFMPLVDRSHLASSGATRLIPIPLPDAPEATTDGLSLEVRRALINAALSPDPSDLVMLGGSLPHSTWGDSDMAYPSFEWIAAHPWIQALADKDILIFSAHSLPVVNAHSEIDHPWLADLQSAPQNSITSTAWQVYLTLTAFNTDSRLQALRNIYLGQVGEILAAAGWAENPALRADCMEDLNGDGHPECILANQKYCAILETAGARLTQFFYLDDDEPHQLVGPSYQFAVGLSDPSEWNMANGLAADPSIIPGAFSDDTGTWSDYTPTILADGLAFTNPDGSRVKTYRLVENGIQVVYQAQSPVSTRISLAVDPQVFYSGPTEYRAALAPHSWTWGQASGLTVEVHTDGVLSAEGFISALPYLALPENPNLEYPRGDYLPFPLSVVTIQADGIFVTEIFLK
jgi:hypothetical protein